jgi:hypothetical protein
MPSSCQSRGPTTIVFASLAIYQTEFFVSVAKELAKAGISSEIICFHQRSVEYVQRSGLRAHDVFDIIRKSAAPAKPVAEWCEEFRIDNLNLLLSHEKATYELYATEPLAGKLHEYLCAIDGVLQKVLSDANGSTAIMVHELGGFLSSLACFYAAQRRGIVNLFFEPSFFRGRVFFSKNTFGAPRVEFTGYESVPDTVRDYLKATVAKQQIVIPKKDKAQYRDAISKITDPYNIKRLFQKIFDQVCLGYQEEFGHPIIHARKHLRMVVNSWRLRGHYRSVSMEKPYVYYPLHVPWDVALTLRAPEHLDQYALIDCIARSLPHTHQLAIKEHPALMGAVDWPRTKRLLEKNDNILLLDPHTNNFNVMRGASAVVTVNSKSGAEALLLGKKVFVLGDAFYRNAPGAIQVTSLGQLPSLFISELGIKANTTPEELSRYFSAMWERTCPGEINDPSKENCQAFAESLLSFAAENDLCLRSPLHPVASNSQ